MFAGFGKKALIGGLIGAGAVAGINKLEGKDWASVGTGAMIGAGLFMGAHGVHMFKNSGRTLAGLGKSGANYVRRAISAIPSGLRDGYMNGANTLTSKAIRGLGSLDMYKNFSSGTRGIMNRGIYGAIPGAGVGAMAGGVYGGFSSNDSIVSGAFKGALLGAGLGAGIGAGPKFVKNLSKIGRARNLTAGSAKQWAGRVNMSPKEIGIINARRWMKSNNII